jgi:hypothetical protein
MIIHFMLTEPAVHIISFMFRKESVIFLHFTEHTLRLAANRNKGLKMGNRKITLEIFSDYV